MQYSFLLAGGLDRFKDFLRYIPTRLSQITFFDILDVVYLAAILFFVFIFLRQRRVSGYLIGIAVLLLIVRKRRLPDGTRFLVYALYVTAVRLAVHPLRDYAGTAAKIVSPILYVADLLVLSVVMIRQSCRGRGERKKDRLA